MTIFDEAKIDCHCHVFDPDRFPYAEGNFYHPAGQERGTPAQFAALREAYGIDAALLVGPNSGYDLDNRCLLDTIARDDGRLKGIAVVRNDASRDELAALKNKGIVGAALNPALFGVDKYADAAGLLRLLGELDMIAQIQVRDDQLLALLPMLESCDTRLLFDHCGRPDIAAGTGQPAFQALLDLGRRGRAGVKLSGYVKFARTPFPYPDARPYVEALLDAFTPDACVWGSDWPFLRAPERVDYGTLLALVERLLPDAADRRKVLLETPRRLFGFAG